MVGERHRDRHAHRAGDCAGDENGEKQPDEPGLEQKRRSRFPRRIVWGASCHRPDRRGADEQQPAHQNQSGGHEQCGTRGDDREGETGRGRPSEVEQFFDDRIEAETLAEQLGRRGEGAPGHSHRRAEWWGDGTRDAREAGQQGAVGSGEREDGEAENGAAEDAGEDGENRAGAEAVDEPGAKGCEKTGGRPVDRNREAGEGDGAGGVGDRVEQGQQHQSIGRPAEEREAEGEWNVGECEHVEITCSPRGRHSRKLPREARRQRESDCG